MTTSISNLPYNKTVADEYYEMMVGDLTTTIDTSVANKIYIDKMSPYATTMYPSIGTSITNTSITNTTNPWITTTTGSGVTWGNAPSWYSQQDNVFHNPTGPAAITKSDVKWYIDGKQIYSTKIFCQLANHTDQSTMFWLLTYGEKLPATPAEYKYLEADLND